jgi:hypothetical protein
MNEGTQPLSNSSWRAQEMLPTLTEAQMARLAAAGHSRQVQPGEVLVEPGSQPTRIFLVTDLTQAGEEKG